MLKSWRRRLGQPVPVVALLIAALAMLLASCGGSARAWSKAPPSPAHATAALAKLARTTVPSVVALPDGYDAATYDQKGHLDFWEQHGTGPWRETGRCRYQLLPGNGPPYIFKVTGKRLAGMAQATFVANGEFTGDTSGDYIAFAKGRHGWGAVVPTANGALAPAGCSTYDGVMGERRTEGFSGGKLETVDAPWAGFFPLVTYWERERGHFIRAGGSAFQSVVASAPLSSGITGLCDAIANGDSGLYDGYVQPFSAVDWSEILNPDLQLLVSGARASPRCLLSVPPTTPLVLQAKAPSQLVVWVRGPAWLLEAYAPQNSSLFIGAKHPVTLRVMSDLGCPVEGPGGPTPAATYAQVELNEGTIVSLALTTSLIMAGGELG